MMHSHGSVTFDGQSICMLHNLINQLGYKSLGDPEAPVELEDKLAGTGQPGKHYPHALVDQSAG